MNKTFKDTGILLHEVKERENDKRLTLLLKEKGKVNLYVRGAALPTSKLWAATQPFVYSDFSFYDGGKFISLNQGKPIIHFKNLLKTYDALMTGMEMLQVLDFFIFPGMECEKALELSLYTFHYIHKKVERESFYYSVFIHKLLMMEGFTDTGNCICGKAIKREEMCVSQAGFLCLDCGKKKGRLLSPKTQEALFYIQNVFVRELFNFHVSDTIEKELKETAKSMVGFLMKQR